MALHCGTQRQFLSVSSTSQRSSWPQPRVAGGSRSARVPTRAVDIEIYLLEPMIENVTYEVRVAAILVWSTAAEAQG